MTLAHPMAVLPLGRLGLPMTALVVGSMVPDIPLFLDWPDGYEATHSMLGVLVIDVVLTVLVVWLWYAAIRDALVDLAPARVRGRLVERVRLTTREWQRVPFAGCLGAASHLFWDSFTHPGRWGPRNIEWLRTEHGGLLGLKWMQYSSGAVGLAVVVWVAVSYLPSLEPLPDTRDRAILSPLVLPAVVLLSGLVGLVSAALRATDGVPAMAFDGVVNSLITAVVLGALACAGWQVVGRLRTA